MNFWETYNAFGELLLNTAVPFFFILFLLSPFYVIFIQRRLRRRDLPRSNRLALLLMICPGLATICALLAAVVVTTYTSGTDLDLLTRVAFFGVVMPGLVVVLFVAFWIVTGIYLFLWAFCEIRTRKSAKRLVPLSRYPNTVLFWGIPVLFLVTGAVTAYLHFYKTLQYAVENGDVRLAHQRLGFNLLGVDANTGYVREVRFGGKAPMLLTDPLLPLAAHKGDMNMVRLLVEHGADVNRAPLLFFSKPVSEAVNSGNLSTVKYLVEHGARFSDRDGWIAFLNGRDTTILTYFLEHGTDPNKYLVLAADSVLPNATKFLLDHGADPNTFDTRTPLQALSEMDMRGRKPEDISQCLDVAKMLVEHGADPCLTTAENPDTPYAIAMRSGNTQLAEYLKSVRPDCCGAGDPAQSSGSN